MINLNLLYIQFDSYLFRSDPSTNPTGLFWFLRVHTIRSLRRSPLSLDITYGLPHPALTRRQIYAPTGRRWSVPLGNRIGRDPAGDTRNNRERSSTMRRRAMILRPTAALLLCPLLLLILLPPGSTALWMSLPSSGAKCVSEEIQPNVVVIADYGVIAEDTTRIPTLSVKVVGAPHLSLIPCLGTSE